jgi:hypothetical protein
MRCLICGQYVSSPSLTIFSVITKDGICAVASKLETRWTDLRWSDLHHSLCTRLSVMHLASSSVSHATVTKVGQRL